MFRNVGKYKYMPYVIGPILWYQVGTYDRNYIRTKMFDKGYNLSQKFKKYPAWDNYAEPMIIKQFSILFTGGNAFIKGMLSDNEDKAHVTQILEEFESNISKELEIKEKSIEQ
jgi:hypothetical protein